MKVMSFNIKHKILEEIFGLWKKRYAKVKDYIIQESPDILGVQELSRKGKKYLTKELTDYQIIGKSRHSFFLSDEYNCLIIKKKYKILSHNTYSLSDKIHSLGRKTKADKFPRICVVAHIMVGKDKFLIVNTHIDNSGTKNKKRLLKIYKRIVFSHRGENEYFIMTGDYNMTLDNPNLKRFADNYDDPFKENKLSSFTGDKSIRAIDHIFLDRRLDFKNAKIHTDSNANGYLSDHYPISCDVSIEKKKKKK